MTQLNTDLTDLSDVTDEAIEAALRAGGRGRHTTANVRLYAKGGEAWAQSIILLARAIQLHPDMIVDPVTRKAREICAADIPVASGLYLSGKCDHGDTMKLAKAAILAGMAMERGS